MARRSLYAVAAAATLALGACSERDPESTTGPQFAGRGGTDPCGFSNSLVNNYFPSSRQQAILSLKQSMANAGHGTGDARTFGFQIMDSIGSASRNFSVSSSAGAQLTMALIGCMFDNASTFTYPHQTDPASDFTAALTNATGGAYYVRGGGTGGVDVPGRGATVLGRIDPPGGVDGNLSGIAPSSGSWTNMLAVNSASEGRALIYGYPVTTTPLVFEWASVPSALTFTPSAVVSVCDDDASGTAMVNEEAVGVLAYVNSGICDTPIQSLTMIDRGWGPKALAARLGRVLVRALAPAPLQATALLTGTGGKTSTIPKSKFGKQSVPTLTVDWLDPAHTPPTPTIKGTSTDFTFLVAVTVSASDQPVFGTCVYLTGSNNNGTPTKLTTTVVPAHDPNCTNPPGGNTDALSVMTTAYTATASQADFGSVGVTKTGGIAITATADVLGRDGAGSKSVKTNVKPAK